VGQPVSDSILLAPTAGLGQIPAGTVIAAISGNTIGLSIAPTGTTADTVLFGNLSGLPYIGNDRVLDPATPTIWTTPGGQQITGLPPVDWTSDFFDPTFSGLVTILGTLLASAIRGTGGAPTATIHTAAGTGASVTSVVGTALSGVVTIATGTGPAAGQLVSVAFATALGSAPNNVVLTPANGQAAANAGEYYAPTGDVSASGFQIWAQSTPGASITLAFNYLVIE
jgi:hypothetical protein